jgi:hypothetical protein
MSRRKQERTGLVGISPNLAGAIEGEFFKQTMPEAKSYWWDEKMESSISQQLYSPRGSQSAIISEWAKNNLDLDQESVFLIETFSNKWGNKYFQLRPSAAVSLFGGFPMPAAKLQVDPDVLVSIPLYCKITGLSMSEIEYDTYYVKLKPEYNHKKFL